MKQMTAHCGLACHECDAFLATQQNDDEMKKEVARRWSGQFHMNINPAEVSCNGCRSDGECLSGYCRACEIRKCGREKNTANCAQCADYACEKLDKFLAMAPEAKKRLDEIRRGV